MQLIMALSTEYNSFPMTLDHLAFPRHLPFEISQFPHVVNFYLPLSGPTPFALVGEEAFSQFGAIFVHQRVGFQV